MMIVIAAPIGAGKSSLAKLLGEHFNSDVFYESVDDNPILPLFYTATDEEIQTKRYPFLLQLHFLNTRFKSIKKALVNDNNVLKASWRGCLMKANTDSKIKVGPIEIENADPDYWNQLAETYKADYLEEQAKLNPTISGYKTSMRRADGC